MGFENKILDLYLKWVHSQMGSVFLAPVSKALTYPLVSVDGKPITIGKILVSFLFLTAGIYLSRIVIKIISSKVLKRIVDSHAARHAIENISFYVMIAFFTLVALQVANIPVTVFNIIGGAIAIAAGLGSQNIMNNFISGLILLIERPATIGDVVVTGDVYGRIEDIGIRATKILSFENKHLIIPNSQVLEGNLHNWTHNSRRIKAEIKVGVRYESPIDKVKFCLAQAAKECPATLKSKEPIILFDNFGDNSLEFSLFVEIKVLNLFDERRVLSSIRENIVKNFLKEGLVIAFPQRDVHLHIPESEQDKFKNLLS